MLEKNLQKKNTDSSTDKLKSCPFCGCELASQPDIFSGGMVYAHENNCIKKLSESPDFRELWNTRPLEDSLRAENAKLREALEKIQVEACNSDYIFNPTWAGFIKIAGIAQEALK